MTKKEGRFGREGAVGSVGAALPVQLVAGLIVNPQEGFAPVRAALEDAWGQIDFESPQWPFDFTDYYAAEMGKGLLRQFFCWEKPRSWEGLHRLKLESSQIEAQLAGASRADVSRPVNIDPGYICHSKLVLFSTKDFAHRIYVGDGIYAESTLEWRGGKFTAHPWTFPDYRTANYGQFFAEVRARYIRKLKSRGLPADR